MDNRLRSTDLFGVRVHDVTPHDVLRAIEGHILRQKKLTISQLGSNTAVTMQRDPALRESLNSMSIVCPDGVAILLASRLLGEPLTTRVTGDILAPDLFEMAMRHEFKFYFLGGQPGVAAAAAARLRQVYTGLTVAGIHHGYFSDEDNGQVLADINTSGAHIVLVGMGVPLQERWVAKHADRVTAPVLITVGGYFDHVLRRVDCYPAWVHRHRLNWVYRLVKEPRRLWRRYLLGGARLSLMVVQLKFRKPRAKPEDSVAAKAGQRPQINARPAYHRWFKRIIDVVISAGSLVVLSPLLLTVALLVKLTSPGPVLYRWPVVGQGGRTLKAYKFRTMVVAADELKKDLLQYSETTGPVFKMKQDPRVTRVGGVLRKFSLDELPQLWSVLKGDMSLVGPRPVLTYEWNQFEDWHRRKLSVKPGAVCLWHVRGQPRDFDEWVKLDLEYIDNWSLWLDLKILLGALVYVITGRNY